MPDQPENLIPARQHSELPANELRWYADPTIFDFPSTAYVEPLQGIIGQRRALDALMLGAEIFSPGYNIFVADRGAVRFDFPRDWIIEPGENGSIKFHDKKPPDDDCTLQITVMYLPDGVDFLYTTESVSGAAAPVLEVDRLS